MENFVERGQTVAEVYQFSHFSICQTSAILNLWGKFWDDPRRKFDDFYTCAKSGCNCISHFDNTKSVTILCI